MKLPPEITFRHMEHSPAIEEMIRDKIGKLDRFSDHIMSCRVVVQPAGKHHEHGNQYEVRIDLTVPHEEIAITREPGNHIEYKDIRTAIRDAFDAACRKLEDYVRRRRGFVKHHEGPPHARVVRLYDDHGFLMTVDGREIYFHKNSVLNGAFDKLEVGTEVIFNEEEGEKGPQASTVRIAGRHHHEL